MSLSGKTILVTGGTGSFGKKFTKVVLKEHDLKVIRIFSRGELLQLQMQQLFDDHPRLRFFIGDVRDKDRMVRAMEDVDIAAVVGKEFGGEIVVAQDLLVIDIR